MGLRVRETKAAGDHRTECLREERYTETEPWSLQRAPPKYLAENLLVYANEGTMEAGRGGGLSERIREQSAWYSKGQEYSQRRNGLSSEE